MELIGNVIPWIISAVSLIFVILTFSRNVNKDNRGEMDGIKESLLKANMKLDQVCATTNETRSDIKSMNIKIQSLDKEVEVIKRDVETAFIRIDELRTKVDESRGSLE